MRKEKKASLEMQRIEVSGSALQVVGYRRTDGSGGYDVTFTKANRKNLSIEELRAFCDALRDDIIGLSYTDICFGAYTCPEIKSFEEDCSHAHRADADGAHGD